VIDPDAEGARTTHWIHWPEFWGVTGVRGIVSGDRMAPNGLVYNPLFALDYDFNIGLLPHKKLYLFSQGAFWTQRATAGVTNDRQGGWDFSKREVDLTIGAAWNYWGPLEARVWGYTLSNLNRGLSLDVPFGYDDGVVVENRWYLGQTNIYDLPRLNFLSLGYYASKDLTGADGAQFHPSLFARAYLTYELLPRQYYVYADTQLITRRPVESKLVWFDDGFAARPFAHLEGLEFRAGVENTWDTQVHNVRTLLYLAVRFVF
jgi:hypothetical protein